jgi:hypothetical protein
MSRSSDPRMIAILAGLKTRAGTGVPAEKGDYEQLQLINRLRF